jgi:hypothetical protein
MFLLAYCGKEANLAAAHGLRLGWSFDWARPLDNILWGVSPFRQFEGPGICFWILSVARVSRIIGAVATLFVSLACGFTAATLADPVGAWAETNWNRVARRLFSGPTVLAVIAADFVRRGESVPDLGLLLPIVVFVFLHQIILARYGVALVGLRSAIPPLVGLLYLGLCFSRWPIVDQSRLPERWIADWSLPSAPDDNWTGLRHHSVIAATDYGHVVVAWLAALSVSCLLPVIRRGLAPFRLADDPPKGELCPS